ncbi:MAG TPA: flagellar hook protein FlgE [Rhodocyclaceae bacterium]|nr:flagellar hook protein FlgE [Rhodocyclaceae bacterium]
MGFQQGLSGLNSSSKALEAIGNNISNSGTVGFKGASAQFADVYAASLAGGGATQIGIGTSVAAVAQQFTQGNITTTNNSLDVAINGNGFFRMQSPSGTISYTRNGQFLVDKNGFIVNSGGNELTGYLANSQGIIMPSSPAPIQINTSDLQPVATGASAAKTGLVIGLNLDSRKLSPSASVPGSLTAGTSTPGSLATGPATFSAVINGYSTGTLTIASGSYSANTLASAVQTAINASLPSGTSVTVSASTGGTLTINAVPGGVGSSVVLNDTTGVLTGVAGSTNTGTAGADNFSISNPLSYTSSTSATVYDSLGNPHTLGVYFVKEATPNNYTVYTNLDGGGTTTSGTAINFTSMGGPGNLSAFTIPQSFVITTGGVSTLDFKLDLSNSTQYGSTFGVNSTTQDGYASGRLSGLSVSPDGTVQGKYSNGQSRNLAQVVLCTFKNPNGLQNLGGNQWEESAASGQPLTGVPGSGTNGMLQSSSVEESNTDLTAELVNMITQQRAYQANAQTIKTQDQVLQTLVNLR